MNKREVSEEERNLGIIDTDCNSNPWLGLPKDSLLNAVCMLQSLFHLKKESSHLATTTFVKSETRIILKPQYLLLELKFTTLISSRIGNNCRNP